MKLPLLTLFSILVLNAQSDQISHSFDISPPRFNQKNINIDGFLDEQEWSNAASHSGFTSYLPVDGRPALDDTEVKIWYTPKSILALRSALFK